MTAANSTPVDRWTLVPAVPEDFEALLALRMAAMRESLERIGRFDPARGRARFASGFSAPHTRHIDVDGRRVGFVAVRPHLEGLLLDHLYLDPKVQGHGLGAAVLAQVLAEAGRAGLPVRVTALRESAANRFYLRHGFVLVEQEAFDNHYAWVGGCAPTG